MPPINSTPSGKQPVPDSPATGRHMHLLRPVATHLPLPMAVCFREDYPPPATCCQTPWLARPIHPVANVRPTLYPFSMRIPANSTTEMEAVTPANSPNPLLRATATFDQADTSEETDVTRIAPPPEHQLGW